VSRHTAIPQDAKIWILAKASEPAIWQPGFETPRPAWSYRDIAENFNRSATGRRLGVVLNAGMVRRLVVARGGLHALRFRRPGRYPRIRKMNRI
jgi:hypothetical protein